MAVMRVGGDASTIRSGLNSVQLRIGPTACNQFIMRARFRDVRALQHDDLVRHAHGGEAVRYENRDAAFRPPCRGRVALEQRVLRFGVEGSRRLVQDEYEGCVAHEAAREGELLPLAEAHVHTAWPGGTKLRVESSAQLRDDVVRART